MKRFIAFLMTAALALPAAGAEDKEHQSHSTTGDSASAGPDFAIQGEYEGEIVGLKLINAINAKPPAIVGAQVIAEGSGKFSVRLLFWGLPGAGWDGTDQVKAAAKTEDGKVRFAFPANTHLQLDRKPGESPYSLPALEGVLAEGKLTGRSDGELALTLHHVLRKSPTLGAKAPPGAIILFDGTSADQWNGGKLVEGNLLNNGITSKKAFKDGKLHVEFRLPFMPNARGQGRANSGVYLQNRYEIQVLDSFGLKGADNECGAIYSQTAPSINMCFPPLSWQTYDVDFKAARFGKDGKKIANAVVTLYHNGVKVLDHVELKGPTAGGQREDDKPGPIQLQHHGNAVVFRNIWMEESK